MKKAKKTKGNTEPTITNMMDAVQDLTEAVQTGFARVDDKFNKMNVQFDEVKYRITALEKRTGSLEGAVEDMKITLNGAARAVDKDSLTIMNHERRIRHLEKARA